MPRGVYARAGRAADAEGAVADDADDAIVQRLVPATSAAPLLTSAARSVFDMARSTPREPPAEIVIRKGVPLPARTNSGLLNGAYIKAAKDMQLGDSVLLPTKQAKSLMRIAREFGNTCTPPPSLRHPHAVATAGRRVA